MSHVPFSEAERQRLRKNLNRSRPSHEVVLSAADALRLLNGYEELLVEREVPLVVDYVECPSCGGIHTDTCHQCKGAGVVPRLTGGHRRPPPYH